MVHGQVWGGFWSHFVYLFCDKCDFMVNKWVQENKQKKSTPEIETSPYGRVQWLPDSTPSRQRVVE